MKISQKGLYALQATDGAGPPLYTQGAQFRIRDIAYEENLPEKFLELILLELKNAPIWSRACAAPRADTACAGRLQPASR
jgi:DNA-binding IscR family transcriptional regulator